MDANVFINIKFMIIKWRANLKLGMSVNTLKL